MKYGFGIDLGGTTVKLAWFREDGQMLDKWEIPTRREENGSRILPDIAASVRAYLQKQEIPTGDILGIGIGVPGPVNEQGVVNRCINLGWGVFNIEKTLSELTGLPVKAGNDATLAALGECWKGSGAGCRNMVFATLGTGVGGGIIVNGQIMYGAHGAGGEIGHIVLEKDETLQCNCGKYGCAEQYCSATGVVRLAEMALAQDSTPSVLRQAQPLTCKAVFDAGREEDPVALAVLEQVYGYMGRFLANVACVVNPEVIVLGGGVSKAGQPLLDGTRKYFDKYVFHAARNIRFALAVLGNDAGAYGAFKLLLP